MIAMSPKSEARVPISVGCVDVVDQGALKVEIGWASWYGAERQGKPTASGELFDKNKLTAAHRKFPLGTRVRVTNLRNRKSTLVRINDRGPGPRERVIDVSWEAARELDFLQGGLALVEVDVISYPKVYPR